MTNSERISISKQQGKTNRNPIVRRMSLLPATSQGNAAAMKIFSSINTKAVEQILGLGPEVVDHLKLIETKEFDIFKIRELTKDNEMVVVISHILAKERIFDDLPIINEKFLSLIKKI